MHSLSLIVPAYNEQDNIKPFLEAVSSAFGDWDGECEVVFVDDGSSDGTWQSIEESVHADLSSESDCCCHLTVRAISFSRNFGKEAAMYAGLEHATSEYCCFIDADLQQRPETARAMLELLIENPDFDCVAACQLNRKHGLINDLSSKFYSFLSSASGLDSVISGASDFRVFNSSVKSSLLSLDEYFRFSKGLFAWIGFKTLPFPYEPDERLSGSSKWSFKKLVKYALDGLMSFSTAPLKIATVLGLLASMAAFLYLVVVLIQKIAFGIEIPGYATLVVLILFLGGVQLLVLGIIGEYLAKMYIQGKHRPIYLTRKSVSTHCTNDEIK